MRATVLYLVLFLLLPATLLSCGSPPPIPLEDTTPNVILFVNRTGPVAGRGSLGGETLLEELRPDLALFADEALPENLVTWQAKRYMGRYGKVRKGEYVAAFVYWAETPYEDYPNHYGTVSEVLPHAPSERFSVFGNSDVEVRFDYNATGSGPHYPVKGELLLSGNPPLNSSEMQLLFLPQSQWTGREPADGYVQSISIGEQNQGRREFETVLNAGTYAVSGLGKGMASHVAHNPPPIIVDLSGPAAGLEVRLRNNWGPRPANLGSVSGVLDLNGWDHAEGLVIEAVREHYADKSDDPGAITAIWSDGFHDFYDEAVWHITAADVVEDKASFFLGWLNDGNYTIVVNQGSTRVRRLPQVTISPDQREVTDVEVAVEP